MKLIYPDKNQDKKINDGIALDRDNPEWNDDMFARAVRGMQKEPVKDKLTIRLDTDIVSWFKANGTGYQSRINKALREYIEHQT